MKKIFCKYSIILIFLSSFTNAYASNDREWDYKINSAKKSCVKIGFAENDPKFKNCVLSLIKPDQMQQNDLIIIQKKIEESLKILEELESANNRNNTRRQLELACSFLGTC